MSVSGWVISCVVAGWALALSVVDVRHRRLPNVLTLSGAAAIGAGAVVYDRGGAAALGALVLSGLYLVVHLVNPAAMGAGDVKLALGLGALTGACGFGVWALAAFGAPVLTAVAGAVSVVRGRGGAVAHGPAMCAASLAATALAVL